MKIYEKIYRGLKHDNLCKNPIKKIINFFQQKIDIKNLFRFCVIFLMFVIIIIQARNNAIVADLMSTIESQGNYINILHEKLKEEKTKVHIERQLIDEKVNNLHFFIKKLYPNYDYASKVKDAFNKKTMIEKLPENLISIYVDNYMIEPHGLKNYELTLKNLIYPMQVDTSFVATKNSEYGRYRPYGLYNFKHEGLDMVNPYNQSVYAIYDCIVWRKYYDRGGGWTLELKFEYESKEGKKQWVFVRYRHLDKIYVNKGDKILQGHIVGSMGNTGFFSLGDHLHWELWVLEGDRWVNINPVQNSTWNNKYIERL